MSKKKKIPESNKLDELVAKAHREREARELSYREQALKLYPWICGRCSREFTRANLQELTVHHKDHNHDNNPSDGSNWELLCVYCHDHEHSKNLDKIRGGGIELPASSQKSASFQPFSDLKKMLEDKDS